MEKKNYHNKNLKELLIDKGIELINLEGFNNFSMRRLSTICKISHNAPYKHFKNKNEFLEAVLDRGVKKFQKALSKPLEDKSLDPTEKLIELGLCYISFFVKFPEYYNIFFKSSLKGQLHIERGNFTYNRVHLFNFLDDAIKSHLTFHNRMNSYNRLIALEFWATVYGLASFITTDKVVFVDDYRPYIKKIVNRLVNSI